MSWRTHNGYQVIRMTGPAFACYLVQKDDMSILIDTSRKFFRKQLLSGLKNQGINTLKYLILTHAHFDHCENAAILKEQKGAVVIAHHLTTSMLESGTNEMIRGSVMATKPITDLFKHHIPAMFRYKPVHPDIIVPDAGYDLSSERLNIRILCTPGHTPGSISIIIDDEIALVGDLMTGFFPGIIFPHFADEPERIYDSWNKLLETTCSIFLPAHGFAIRRKTIESAARTKK